METKRDELPSIVCEAEEFDAWSIVFLGVTATPPCRVKIRVPRRKSRNLMAEQELDSIVMEQGMDWTRRPGSAHGVRCSDTCTATVHMLVQPDCLVKLRGREKESRRLCLQVCSQRPQQSEKGNRRAISISGMDSDARQTRS